VEDKAMTKLIAEGLMAAGAMLAVIAIVAITMMAMAGAFDRKPQTVQLFYLTPFDNDK
jgi:hypothetical protein